MKLLKNLNFVKNLAISYFQQTALFVRIIPSDNCNLNCRYCYQKRINAPVMQWDFFCKALEKAVELRVGLVNFLGGEPMLWEHLYDAIALCSKRRILTDMTTNGTLLDDAAIKKLGASGLDYLNISVDTRDRFSVSKKNSLFNPGVVEALRLARQNHGMKFRMNSVICKNNFEDVKLLLELSKGQNIPLSLCFVVPDMNGVENSELHFTENDAGLLREMVDYVLRKKKEGCPVIDPDSYFTNVFKFVRRERFWLCNYPTRFGWINVTANGTVRNCTKKMEDTGVDFLSLTPCKIQGLKKMLEASVEKCNPFCYSNCAYDSAFYKKHKAAFVVNKIKNF